MSWERKPCVVPCARDSQKTSGVVRVRRMPCGKRKDDSGRSINKKQRQRLGMAAASQPLSVGGVDLRTADAQVFDAQAAMEIVLGCGKVFVTSGADCVEHAAGPSGSARDVEEEHAASLSWSTSHAEGVGPRPDAVEGFDPQTAMESMLGCGRPYLTSDAERLESLESLEEVAEDE